MKSVLTYAAIVVTAILTTFLAVGETTDNRDYSIPNRRDITSLERYNQRMVEIVKQVDVDVAAVADGTGLTGNFASGRITNALDLLELFLAGNVKDAALTNAMYGIVDHVTVTADATSATQARVTVTCKDVFGSTLAQKKTIQCWFTTYDVTSVPSESGIESWNWSGDTLAALDLGAVADAGTNLMRIVRTDATGSSYFTVTSDVSGWTNRLTVYGPNGAYTNVVVPYTD